MGNMMNEEQGMKVLKAKLESQISEMQQVR